MAATVETKDEIRRSLDEEAERALDEASVHVREEGLECVTSTREGVLHREIGTYAHEVGINLACHRSRALILITAVSFVPMPQISMRRGVEHLFLVSTAGKTRSNQYQTPPICGSLASAKLNPTTTYLDTP
jgi:hypothetical protein